MGNRIKRNLTSDNVAVRLVTAYTVFLIVFTTVTIISYYLLPEGLLLNKHPLKNWDTSPTLVISSLQIFSFNLLSVIVILFGNIFTYRKNKEEPFMSLGYLAFFVQIIINAVILGTWSFSMAPEVVPLFYRIVGTFDILHRAGLWEMTGQLFILCATVNISLIISDGKETITKNWKTIRLSKKEIIIIVIGFALMITGAIIESNSIINFISGVK